MTPSKDIQDAAEYGTVKEYKGSLEQFARDNFIAGATHPTSNPELQEKYRQVVEERDRLKAEAEKMTELIALLITLSPNKDKYVEALASNSKQQP